MDTITKIQIARCNATTPMENRIVAAVHLNTFNHLPGQPVMVNYYRESGKIDTIVAIGIKTGTGPDCYSIISEGGKLFVGGVIEDIVDVSSLVHDIPYISKVNGEWKLITIRDVNGETRRDVQDIPSDVIIHSLGDGHTYFYKDGEILRDDSLTDLIRPELDALQFGRLILSVTPKESYKKGSGSVQPQFEVKVMTEAGEDVTNSCQFSASTTSGSTPCDIYMGTLTMRNSVSDTTEYTITATYRLGESEITVSEKATASFVSPVLYGNPETEELWDGTGSLVLFFDLTDEKAKAKVPIEYPVFTHIYDAHRFDYIDEYNIYPSGDYRIYEKKDAVTIHNFKQEFTYGSGNANN